MVRQLSDFRSLRHQRRENGGIRRRPSDVHAELLPRDPAELAADADRTGTSLVPAVRPSSTAIQGNPQGSRRPRRSPPLDVYASSTSVEFSNGQASQDSDGRSASHPASLRVPSQLLAVSSILLLHRHGFLGVERNVPIREGAQQQVHRPAGPVRYVTSDP